MAERQTDLFGAVADDGAAAGLSYNEKIAWIRLIRSEGVGPATFHELIAHFGAASTALDALPGLRRRSAQQGRQGIASRDEAEREWDAASRLGAAILAFPEPGYPPLLRQIPAPPPLIYARGDTALAAARAVAIVGSRDASAIGRRFACDLARDLGREGIVIVSGLARGIDTAAHGASLATGTVAVIAGGVDMIYPPENAALHEAIAEQGLLLCENPPGSAPRGQDFPRRNRIISGVSSGVAVIEAAEKSGSLITARLAAEQGREVFAAPGHPLDPRAAGTNGLIRNGAHMATCAADIVAELWPDSRTPAMRPHGSFRNEVSDYAEPPRLPPPSGDTQETVLKALSYTPVHPDLLLQQTGLAPRTLSIILLQLHLSGRIDRQADQCVSLRPPTTLPGKTDDEAARNPAGH